MREERRREGGVDYAAAHKNKFKNINAYTKTCTFSYTCTCAYGNTCTFVYMGVCVCVSLCDIDLQIVRRTWV